MDAQPKKRVISTEKRREYNRRYREKHPEIVKKCAQKYQKSHPEIYKNNTRAFRERQKAEKIEQNQENLESEIEPQFH